jgi:hypothetical protein
MEGRSIAMKRGFGAALIARNLTGCFKHPLPGLTDFLYQRDGETIAFARPDLAVSGTGSSSVAPVVDIPALSAA